MPILCKGVYINLKKKLTKYFVGKVLEALFWWLDKAALYLFCKVSSWDLSFLITDKSYEGLAKKGQHQESACWNSSTNVNIINIHFWVRHFLSRSLWYAPGFNQLRDINLGQHSGEYSFMGETLNIFFVNISF